jgi:hypothetical protein
MSSIAAALAENREALGGGTVKSSHARPEPRSAFYREGRSCSLVRA